MDITTKLDIIKSEPTEEIVTEQDLISILENNSKPVHYFGLEISGMPHIGHILCAGKKINDFAKAGFQTNILLADWHTVANQKLGGDWERIRKAGEFYKKLFAVACPSAKVKFGSELYHNNNEYWKEVMEIATKTTIARATRTLIIQGRSEKDTLYVSQYIYPIMQVADIRAFGADVAHAGIDQRKVHMLAREAFKELNEKRPLALLHTRLIQSLLEPPKINEGAEKEEIVTAMKMSKSKPGSSIPILSSPEGITLSKNGDYAYVVNNGNDTISIVNTLTKSISSTIPSGYLLNNPTAITISPNKKYAYFPYAQNELGLFNTSTNTISSTIKLNNGVNIVDIAFSPNGQYSYLVLNNDTLAKFNTATNTVVNTISGNFQELYGVAIAPNGQYGYITDEYNNTAYIFNTNTDTITGIINNLQTPTGVAFSPSGNYAYIANSGNYTASIINTNGNTISGTIKHLCQPNFISFAPNGNYAYLTSSCSNKIYII